jgi:hypothetical protein
MRRKEFPYRSRVRVKLPGKRAFFGFKYSEYRLFPRSQRLICVEIKSGAGIAYPIRYVTLVRQ